MGIGDLLGGRSSHSGGVGTRHYLRNLTAFAWEDDAGSMGTWYRVTFPYKDCGIGGKGQRLQDAFAAILISRGGKPDTAALFSERSEDFERLHYYFTPDSMQIAASLIESYMAVPCDAPQRPKSIENHVALSVGDARIFEMLW